MALSVQMFDKRVHQIDSENGWLLLSASFASKFGIVFILTPENAFS